MPPTGDPPRPRGRRSSRTGRRTSDAAVRRLSAGAFWRGSRLLVRNLAALRGSELPGAGKFCPCVHGVLLRTSRRREVSDGAPARVRGHHHDQELSPCRSRRARARAEPPLGLSRGALPLEVGVRQLEHLRPLHRVGRRRVHHERFTPSLGEPAEVDEQPPPGEPAERTAHRRVDRPDAPDLLTLLEPRQLVKDRRSSRQCGRIGRLRSRPADVVAAHPRLCS